MADPNTFDEIVQYLEGLKDGNNSISNSNVASLSEDSGDFLVVKSPAEILRNGSRIRTIPNDDYNNGEDDSSDSDYDIVEYNERL